MSIRLKGLSSIDPLSVPLPHGTEVTTRVDRLLGERKIPAGAVGRVVGSREGGLFEVMVPGAGSVTVLDPSGWFELSYATSALPTPMPSLAIWLDLPDHPQIELPNLPLL